LSSYIVTASNRAHHFEAAQMRADQKCAASLGQRGADQFFAVKTQVEQVVAFVEQVDAVVDGRTECHQMPPDIEPARRPAQRTREVGTRGLARGRRKQHEIDAGGRQYHPAQAPAEA
jgi:hypothetical protein